jgi:hypothetical protein
MWEWNGQLFEHNDGAQHLAAIDRGKGVVEILGPFDSLACDWQP